MFTKDAYLPRFAGSVFRFFIARCSSETVLTFMKLKSHCTFVVSVVLLLIANEKKTWSICRFYDYKLLKTVRYHSMLYGIYTSPNPYPNHVNHCIAYGW